MEEVEKAIDMKILPLSIRRSSSSATAADKAVAETMAADADETTASETCRPTITALIVNCRRVASRRESHHHESRTVSRAVIFRESNRRFPHPRTGALAVRRHRHPRRHIEASVAAAPLCMRRVSTAASPRPPTAAAAAPSGQPSASSRRASRPNGQGRTIVRRRATLASLPTARDAICSRHRRRCRRRRLGRPHRRRRRPTATLPPPIGASRTPSRPSARTSRAGALPRAAGPSRCATWRRRSRD